MQSLVVVVVVLVVAVAGCGDDVRRHTEGEGPLSVQNAGGGVSLDPPRHTPWHGSFGGFHPCVAQRGPVVLDRVEPHVDPAAEPLVLEILHRSVVLEDPANHDGHISAIGVPPGVDHGRMRGEFTTDVAGLEVSVPCSDAATEGVEVGELYVVVEADGRGARIEGLTIHYHDRRQGTRYALEVDWEMVACGDAIDDDEIC